MVSDDSSTTSGRHTARKQAAHELAGRTGMKYTEALRHVSDTGAQRTPRWPRTGTHAQAPAGGGLQPLRDPATADTDEDDEEE